VSKAQRPALPQLAQFRRIMIKVGSSLLVDPQQGAVKRDWLATLAGDMAGLHQDGADVLVVSSGAVALGRSVLGLPKGSFDLRGVADHAQPLAAPAR